VKALSYACACLALAAAGTAAQPAADPPKVLRYALPVAETGFDPAQISDLYSRNIAAGIFETPLCFDFLARPARMKPLTAAALPEVSADFRRFTFRIRPGIYFADDPAFRGQRRELVAEDYVYTLKRHYDPRWKSPNLYLLENAKLRGLSELRRQAIATKQPFPYDTGVEGLRALDRYTFQVSLADPAPRFAQTVMTDQAAFGAVAREVVEFYGDRIMEHPVGTGPFKLGEWRRSSRIVLDRNPGFRMQTYDEQAPAGDARSQAIARRLHGRRMPMLDRVEISIVAEAQPRWLSFLNGEADLIDRLPAEFAGIVIPNDRLAPNLQKRGIQMDRASMVDVTIAIVFNMKDPLVGGYAPEKVALRRAISLAYDSGEEVRLVRRGQATVARQPVAPAVFGHDPAFDPGMGEHDVARAKALLDLYGYLDRDGDGWREQPDGRPLTIVQATQSDGQSRQLDEQLQKALRAIGIRVAFKVAQWPENLKAVRAGRLMTWGVAWNSTTPDGDTFLALGYGPNGGGANTSYFDLPAFNALYVRQHEMPDGPERLEVMQQAAKLMAAYMPYKISANRIATDLMQPWVIGHRRNPFVREFYKYLDIDTGLQRSLAR